MMAMKFFQPSLSLGRDLEFDIWRESNLVESYGTSKEGLALAASRRGFDVYTLGRHLRHSFVDAIADQIPGVDYQMLELLYRDTRRKFRSAGLRNLALQVTLRRLKAALGVSHIPILLTSTRLFGGKEDLPHWVALSGFSEAVWFVNNPLAVSPNTQVEQTKLTRRLGYRGVQCAVVVRGLREERGSQGASGSKRVNV
jgi:hypothetical protein